MTPKKLQAKLDKLEAEYEKAKEALAKEYFEKRIVPYCDEHKLSFTMMNGVPRFINLQSEYVSLPRFLSNIVDVSDSEGNRIMWDLPEYKYSPEVCANQADHKFWSARSDHIAEAFGNDMTKVALYHAFSV